MSVCVGLEVVIREVRGRMRLYWNRDESRLGDAVGMPEVGSR